MKVQVLEIEAESLEEAREQLNSQMAERYDLLSEKIISDGKPKTVNAVADTTEAAFAKAQGEIPDNADILERRVLISPARKVITVDAFDKKSAEASARFEARSQFDGDVVLQGLGLKATGRKGLLGIGKKPNQYEAEICRQAFVAITYKPKVKISARIRKRPTPGELQELVEAIVTELESKDKDVRDAAIEKLLRMDIAMLSPASELLVGPLISILRSWRPQARKAAAGVLIKIGTPAVESLISVLKDEDEGARGTAAMALGEIGDTRAVEPLIVALQGKGADAYLAAAKALDNLDWQPDMSEAGAACWTVRHQWDKCVEIGVLAVKPLFITLQDADETVQKAAAKALVQIGEPAVDLLVSLLDKYFYWTHTDASSLILCVNCAKVLGKTRDPRAIKVLIKVGSERVFASDSQRSPAGQRWVDPSSGKTKMETWDHRRAAADALAMIGEPAVEPLIAALEKKDANLRQLAAWALGQIGDTRAVEPLIPVLSSRYHDRAATRKALRAITGKDFGEDVGRWQEWWREFAPDGRPHTDQVNAVQ